MKIDRVFRQIFNREPGLRYRRRAVIHFKRGAVVPNWQGVDLRGLWSDYGLFNGCLRVRFQPVNSHGQGRKA